MKKVFKTLTLMLPMFICGSGLAACGQEEKKPVEPAEPVEPDSFSICCESQVYFLDKDAGSLTLSINDGYKLTGTHDVEKLKFEFVSNNCQGKLDYVSGEWHFKAQALGDAVIKGVVGDLESSNIIGITSVYSDDYIVSKLEKAFDTDGGVVLGQTYDIGISKDMASSFKIVGADGILKINEDGLLEVIGIGQGRVTLKKDDEDLKTLLYTVYNSMLATKIKEDLISQGKIVNKASLVTNDLLEYINELDMTGELVNDPQASYGIKYFKNLEVLNLSSNNLKDASFISNLENIKDLDLSDNEFDDLSSIVNCESLERLNMANNKLVSITKLQYLHQIQYLDLSNNNIENISPLSSLYTLESLLLDHNKIKNFKDSISGLESLKELSVAYCDIPFTDIRSLKYVNNLESLDISGTDVDLILVGNLSNLKELYLEECHLDEKNLSPLNNLVNLEVLDIGQNDISKETYNDGLDPAKLVNLVELGIGGSMFLEIPDLSGFKNLKTLDLTNSYNLTSIECLKNLGIETLILDNCNRIDSSEIEVYKETINSLKNLKRLSIVGGFNYMTNVLYTFIKDKVANGLTLRMDENKWIDKTTIVNYNQAIYFSLAELIDTFSVSDGVVELKSIGGTEHIILILVNDALAETTPCEIRVDNSIFKLEVYGKTNTTYDLQFVVEDRKASSVEFDFHDLHILTSDTVFSSVLDAKIIVNAYGTVVLESSREMYANYVFDFKAYTRFSSSTLAICSTFVAPNGDSSHKEGYDGATAIYCNSCVLNGNITVTGTNGGRGRNGDNRGMFEGDGQDGFRGGNGGHAIDCVQLDRTYTQGNVKLVPGLGGEGGKGGTHFDVWASNGKKGESGTDGSKIHRRATYR